MADIDEKIEILRAAMRQNCINLSRANDERVKLAIMDNINNIWMEIHMLKQRKSSSQTNVSRMRCPTLLLPLPPPPPPPPASHVI